MKKVIFLDIDGVLNSQETCDKFADEFEENGYGGFFKETDAITHRDVLWGQELVDKLRIIAESTGAEIVVSSTWRKYFSIEKFKEMFSLYGWENAPIIDKTQNLNTQRGFEINKWLTNNKIDNYLILDDSTDFLPEQLVNFVNTNPFIGITDEDVEKSIKILNHV